MAARDDGREAVLAALRRARVPAAPLPSLEGLGVRFDDPAGQFAAALTAVGGVCVRVHDLAAADAAVRTAPAHGPGKRIASLVPGVGQGTFDAAALADPHALEGLDLSILPGELGVGENGAVWVDGAKLPHRALHVIPEHLVLVLDAAHVVSDMHEAYARLAAEPVRFGLFICGPSKTADIEQSLVIGAQGARSCTVYLVGA